MLNHAGTQRLETQRLILRHHEMSDADDMYQNWVTDPEVSRFWTWEPHKNIDETKSLLAVWIDEYKKLDHYNWIIVLKEISQAIGYIYLADINDGDNSVSIHYALSRKYWNQGIMTEACKCIIEFAFDILNVDRIHTHHHIKNPASGKVMQKCGMRYVKTEYKEVADNETLSGDRCYYELLKG